MLRFNLLYFASFYFLLLYYWRERKKRQDIIRTGMTKEILEQNQIKGILIPQLAKITTLYPDWQRSLNQKKGQLFDCIERHRGLERHPPLYLNAALNVDLFQNIFWDDKNVQLIQMSHEKLINFKNEVKILFNAGLKLLVQIF